ncbi:MAG TPA: hypothetical protein VN457_08205 [Chlamydiales bacterium]|nr:hypothetical protein [Chlamydiales bacterium]
MKKFLAFYLIAAVITLTGVAASLTADAYDQSRQNRLQEQGLQQQQREDQARYDSMQQQQQSDQARYDRMRDQRRQDDARYNRQRS